MRKYFAVAKTLLKAQLVYRFSIFSGILQIAVRLLFAWLLWSAVFGGPDSTALVGGFTFGGMFSYYVVSSFLLQLEMSEGVSGEISARIRDGSFSKFMVIPTGVQLHFGAQTAGAALYYLLFNLAATVALSLLFGVRIELSAEPWTLAAAALMCLMGLVFMVQLHFFLGILTFRFENISIFLMIQNLSLIHI